MQAQLKTHQECQEACAAKPSCVAVDWKNKELKNGKGACFLHENIGEQYTFNVKVTRFDIVRRCNTKSSTCHDHFYIGLHESFCWHNNVLCFTLMRAF